ncbi:thioredoxin [Buchnera aphidicola]|uniref:Thioredoxin n=2 Tax=Buchnera aphidicola (Cinara cedri) TaxID=261318 RepID=Q056W6_BUCCC|nr:thioredoxin [Buchnera aphidicola]AAW72677.1 thioredoxin [Buchnera aphidicola (Cinara cedri)]ABJ90833.1 thioredoxin [Buchnera aphidicola BCc]
MKVTKIIELTDQNFEKKVFFSKKFFLVDFWADWCGPCKILSPILEEIAHEYYKKIFIGKINIDINKNIPIKFSIKGIPALLLFNKKKIIGTKIGLITKVELKNFLDKKIVT